MIKTISILFLISTFCCNPPPAKIDSKLPRNRSQEIIKSVIDEGSNKLKYVYENALKRNPNLSGKFKIKFIIKPNGFLKDISVINSTISDTQFVNEFINKINNWKFPEIKDTNNIEVVFPFVFESHN